MMETETTITTEITKLNNSCEKDGIEGSNIDSSCGINSGDIVSNESCSLKSLNISISTINNGSTSGINSSSGGNSPKTPSLQNTTTPPPALLNLSDALLPLRELYSCLYVGDIRALMSNEYLNFEEDEKIRCLGFPEPHLEINEKTQKYFSYQIIDFDSDEDILSIAKQFEQYSQLILGRTSTQPVVIQECCFGLILAAVYFIKYELFSLPQAHDLIQYNDFFGTTNKHSHFEKVDSCTLINDITTYYYNNMTKRKTPGSDSVSNSNLAQLQKPLPTTPTTKDKENSISSTSSAPPQSSNSSTTTTSSSKLKVSGGLLKKIFKKHSSGSNSKDKEKEKDKDKDKDSNNVVKKESKKEREARETKEREAREKELELELKNIPPEDLYKHQMKKIQMIQQQQIMELNGGVAAAPGATNVNAVTTTTTTTTPGGGLVTTSNNSLGEPGLIAQANLMDPEMIENYDDGSDRLKNSKTIISATYNELPDEYKTMVKSWDIKQESIDLHFDIILSLLHFHTKQRFYQSDAALQNYTTRPKYYNIGNVCGSCSPPIVISSSSSTSTSQSTNSVSTSFYKKPFDQICKKPTNEMKKLYTIRERVGKGGFGTVYLARNNADKTKSRIAIKKLPHVRKKERKFNVKEIRVLEFTKHPNIITYYNSHMLSDEVWIAMEFMEGGTLAEASNQYPFQESNIAYVAREVLQGLAYLHGIQLVHRDLKSQNIMMTTSGEIKIIDFGLCANLSKGERIRMCGSPIWMPPEMIQQRQHGYTCDIWSTAICLLELANRNNKLRKNPIKTMFMVGSEGIKEPFEDPNRWSDSFHDLINKCLQIDPHDRPSAQELLKHPFIQLADNKKKMGKILSSIFLKSIIGV